MKTTQAVQTDNLKVLVGTQTNVSEERLEMREQFVSRINYNIASQEERAPNEEPLTMTRTQPEATQLEASLHEIKERLVATVSQATMTEIEEDTPKTIAESPGGKIHRRSYKKGQKSQTAHQFCEKAGL